MTAAPRGRGARALALLAGFALGGAAAAEPAAVPAPPACRRLAAGDSLSEALAAASDGDALCLAPGDWQGPVRLARRVALWGPRGAVIHSAGEGTTVSIEAAGAALLGVTVDGSGGRFDLLDAAVRVTADDARVEGVAIRGALFGILVEQAKRVQVRDDDVSGRPEAPLGLRGDAIRLWEVSDSAVEGNRVRDSRDVVVWYSPRNHIARNEVLRGRYGTHLMYSHGNRIEGNRYVENVVGIFAMYSRDLAIEGNLVARSGGAAGVGLGTKESGNLDVRDNWFVANTVGLYLDTSPLYLDETNTFERNVFEFGDTAVVFHGGAARNRFEDNRFRDNGSPVRVEGRGNARDALWRGNEFGDYQGYDLDGDGFGDLPYELRSLSGALTARHPALAFLRGTPAMALVELVGRVVPLFQPETLLVDPAPRMRSDAPERAPGAG